jgi:GNAT superfamily N-acetyltransferase
VTHGPDLDVAPLTAGSFDAFAALFAEAPSACACRWWHFTETKNAWLDRCAHRPEENVAEARAAVLAGDPSADGLLATARDARPGEAALGWMKLTPRSVVSKLRSLPVYRTLDLGPEDTTFAIGCFLVHPRARHTGVARALLAAAEPYARSRGARALEGYPRRSPPPLYDEEVWQGPEVLFREAGFQVVHDIGPYPGRARYRSVSRVPKGALEHLL